MSKTCFVIMPITTPLEERSQYHGDTEHFVHVFDHLFKPALQAADYAVVGPLVEHSEVIQAVIIKNLNASDLVLCDISLWNANVFFELGIRVALNKPVALVRDSLTRAIPFDNAIVSCHEYDASLTPWRLPTEVEMLKKFVCGVGKQSQNALWKYFGIAQQAAVLKEGDPIGAKLDLLLSELSSARQGQRVVFPQLASGLDRVVRDARIKTDRVLRGIHEVLRSATGDANPSWIKIDKHDGRIMIYFEHGSRENAERNTIINLLEGAASTLSKENLGVEVEIEEYPF